MMCFYSCFVASNLFLLILLVDTFVTYIHLSSLRRRMKLESASTSSLEDRVKRNIYSLQRTSVALEKNFMKR